MTILGLCFNGSAHGVDGHHDPLLVAVSYIIAAFASFTALEMAERLRDSSGAARRFWHVAAAVTLGGGIWSMHFVAMLAFRIPLAQAYDPPLTIISGLVAIAAVAVGFQLFEGKVTWPRTVGAGVFVGLGVVIMHYTGMSALRVPGQIYYKPDLFVLSVVIAIAAATAALWLAYVLRFAWQRGAAAMVMALAICGMHYTGMAATVIVGGPPTLRPLVGAVQADTLAGGVIVGVAIILCLGLVCTFVDRRLEQRSVEEAKRLRALNETLEARVEARTAELRLAVTELERASRRAEAASQAKSDFLATMSHEIRTPLTSVIGFADLLAKSDGIPELAQTYIQRIATAGQSLMSVINDVLDFSKLEAGQVELDPHPFDPAECVEAVVGLLASQAANKDLALETDITDDMPERLTADGARIRQVLINLLGNAVKFTTAGRVVVSASWDAGASGQLRIAVSDTGPGIAEDMRDRLFERFSQVDGTVSRHHGGTGLGLAISKSLIELMGGIIGVDSEVGKGSTFWFCLPATIAAAAAETAVPSDADREASRPVHILLVDDVAVNRELVRAVLGPLGHSFEEADNGADAVTAAMRLRFDLILMDLQMPGMDGFAAARAIRATAEPNRDTPILAFSANVLSEHIAAALCAGMNDHITKPIQLVELLTKVAMWTADPGDQVGELNIAS